MTETTISRWIGADGWPTDAYFDAVADALAAAGISLVEWRREEPWSITFHLDPQHAGPDYAEVYVGWEVGEEDDLTGGEVHGPGWHWVPYTDVQKPGVFAKELPVDLMAEPEQVAAAIAGVVAGLAKAGGR